MCSLYEERSTGGVSEANQKALNIYEWDAGAHYTRIVLTEEMLNLEYSFSDSAMVKLDLLSVFNRYAYFPTLKIFHQSTCLLFHIRGTSKVPTDSGTPRVGTTI
jgi:hypothetical protein